MYVALATWEPLPMWFRFIFAVPRTAPASSTATTTRFGAATYHHPCASSFPRSGG